MIPLGETGFVMIPFSAENPFSLTAAEVPYSHAIHQFRQLKQLGYAQLYWHQNV